MSQYKVSFPSYHTSPICGSLGPHWTTFPVFVQRSRGSTCCWSSFLETIPSRPSSHQTLDNALLDPASITKHWEITVEDFAMFDTGGKSKRVKAQNLRIGSPGSPGDLPRRPFPRLRGTARCLASFPWPVSKETAISPLVFYLSQSLV